MRKALVVLALLLVVGSVGWVVQRQREAGARADAVRRADVAWAVLEKCLVGEPLREGERATVRLRRVASAAGAEKDWPSRCAPHARALKKEVLAVAGEPRFERLPLYLFELEEDLDQGRVPRDPDELWQAAALARLGQRSAPVEVPSPPAAAAPPVEPGRLPLLADGTAHVVDPVPGGPLRLFFRRPARLCAFDAGGLTVRCRAAKDALGGGELVPADPGARPLLRLLESEQAGLWSPEGERLVTGAVTTAHAFADGSFAMVDWTPARGYLLHRGKASVPLSEGDDFRFLGDQLVWRTPHGPSTARLVAARVPSTLGDFGSVLVLGSIPEGARVASCRSGETRALAAAPASATSTEVQVALAPDGRWLPNLLGATVEHDWDAWRLDCRKGLATLTWTTRGAGMREGEVDAHQMRCDLTGCGQMEARLSGIGRGSPPLVADLEGKLLTVWYHDDDSVRLRLGEIVDLAHASELVLVDAERHGGLAVEGLELHTMPGAAIVLLASPKGTHAIRIEPSGGFEPVQVVEEK